MREYIIVSVYKVKFSEANADEYSGPKYYRPNYNYDPVENKEDIGYYSKYIKEISEIQEYNTGEKLSVTDRTLTLQTCISGDSNFDKQIVVCKEIGRRKYVSEEEI